MRIKSHNQTEWIFSPEHKNRQKSDEVKSKKITTAATDCNVSYWLMSHKILRHEKSTPMMWPVPK